MAETTETREEREARWWREWFEADYSWEGLAKKEIYGGGQFGEQTLQDYWRRDPATNKRRTDEALKATGELFELESRWWHIAHLPPRGQAGWKSWKADLGASEWARLKALMAARLAVAVETPGTFGFVDDGRSWKPEASDGRALFDGAVLGPGPIHPDGEVSPISLSCRRSAFLGTSDFDGVTFGLGADFFGATFSGDASFTSATFSGDASFDRATFSGDARFDSADFLGDASFDIATSLGDASFDIATFSGDASFTSATFSREASFIGATFSGEARFNRAIVSGEASFVGATFSGEARFNRATFLGDASFYHATFSGEARFNRATFSSEARFNSATCSSEASFSGATFSGVALFSGRFDGRGRFQNAVFESPVTFSVAIAAPERDFPKAFYGARFAGIADFSGAVGGGQGGRMAAAFAEAQFEKALILTDGLDGKQGQVFHKTLLANTWDTAEDQKARDAAFATLESGCRVVKIAMGKARDEVREQAYYRLQLRARHQRQDIDAWEKAIGWLYGVTSEFGSSLWRPLAGLPLLVLVFAVVIYWPWMDWLNIRDADGPGGVFVALNHSLRTLSPFNLLATAGVHPSAAPASLFEVNPAVTFGARLVSGLQSILSTLLVFLFGLAVKRRFQIS